MHAWKDTHKQCVRRTENQPFFCDIDFFYLSLSPLNSGLFRLQQELKITLTILILRLYFFLLVSFFLFFFSFHRLLRDSYWGSMPTNDCSTQTPQLTSLNDVIKKRFDYPIIEIFISMCLTHLEVLYQKGQQRTRKIFSAWNIVYVMCPFRWLIMALHNLLFIVALSNVYRFIIIASIKWKKTKKNISTSVQLIFIIF